MGFTGASWQYICLSAVFVIFFYIPYKGGFKSENLRQFFGIPKNIPKSCFKFVHPVHDIDKTLILNFFDFTSLTYLLVAQKRFTIPLSKILYCQSLLYIHKYAAMILFYSFIL